MKFKKWFLILLAVLMMHLSAPACFFDDPNAYIGTQTVSNGGGAGGGVWTESWVFDSNNFMEAFRALIAAFEQLGILIQTAQSFPMTLNTEFTGFADGSKVTRACLLYLNREGYWIILKDIKDPVWDVATNTGKSLAIFGKNSLPSSMGYKFGEVLTVRTYYKSATQETFDLETTLKTKVTNRSGLENVINIFVHFNTTPE